ncbi:hypothetical protein Cri9333_4619 [Crinalium epipsammum PCC 9333]|uniref:Uncharacterized protein n=1 Tax=Crinalium epipsammum PCC 9333 TaxID=1173022 RepID=K9W6G0_9CYAN|nr:hypothetical protein [Crinalium epipsammum]AFZ15399.1 hypothetical protein Cri9333_4619 [Crinalium epipsammum PCC 9333]
MERGLLWLPLLFTFIWLAWSGWNEYQKVEAYRSWASQFDQAKYDIYAVLGQKGKEVTWGKPTRKGIINLQNFSLKNVQAIQLLVNNQVINLAELPDKGNKIFLEFRFSQSNNSTKIPFTEVDLAAKWAKYLQQELERCQQSTTN